MTNNQDWKNANKKMQDLKPYYEKLLTKIKNLENEIKEKPDENKMKKYESYISLKQEFDENSKIIQTISFFSTKNTNPEEFIQNICDLKALCITIDELEIKLKGI